MDQETANAILDELRAIRKSLTSKSKDYCISLERDGRVSINREPLPEITEKIPVRFRQG